MNLSKSYIMQCVNKPYFFFLNSSILEVNLVIDNTKICQINFNLLSYNE